VKYIPSIGFNKQKAFLFSLLVVVVTQFISCKKEPIPAYIYLDSVNVLQGNLGSSSSNIVDIWVFQNDNPQGVYEMPVTFPIIAEGNTTLTFQGGIKVNGVTTTRVSYPFYTNYTTTLNLVPGKIDTVKPQVTYLPATKVALIEDFEGGNAFTGIERVFDTRKVFEGNVSGRMNINIGDSSVISYNTTRFAIPKNVASVFVELDYKNNKVFNVSLRGFFTNSGESIRAIKLNVTNKDDWNKIYINFTPEIYNLQADTYELIFQYVEDDNFEPVDILFDNIKVIYL
jgi:hypothetical protein